MKTQTLICSVMLMVFASAALAQGTVVFQNYGVNSLGQNWSAPIYNQDGSTPLDNSYDVALYISSSSGALGGIPDPGNLVPGSTTRISGAGLFSGSTLTFLQPEGTFAFVAVAVWKVAYGSTFQEAFGNFSPWGSSYPVEVQLGSATSPGSLYGIKSFSLITIPEPRTLALCGLGWLAVSAPPRFKLNQLYHRPHGPTPIAGLP